MIPLTTIKNTHFFPASVVEDQVVSACVWEDGGGEFVYGDGSLLSFADCMNTFVAFSPYIPASSTKENQARSSYYTEGQKVTSPKAEMERDMSFTAWALSKYKKKVMSALYLYNRYSVHPRVLVDYIPSPVEEWKLSSPIEALVLCKHRSLLRRRKVYAVGHVAYTPEDEITFPSVQREARVPVGTQVTLWCALQRVSLTIHANRTTFSVRWPVPVEGTPASVKQRREALFCSLSESSINIAGGASVGSCGADLDLLLGKKKTYFTWMESVFPIDDPPEVWRVMLQMALELDAEVPLTTDGEEEEEVGEPTAFQPDEKELLHLSLPKPLSNKETLFAMESDRRADRFKYRDLPMGCRFSKAQPEHVHLLVSSGPRLQGASCNRAIHGASTAVLWRYDADLTGNNPHALFWSLPMRYPGIRDGESAPEPTPPGEAGAVLALVEEDFSCLRLEPIHNHQYKVRHRRCDGREKEYFVSAGDLDAAKGLPLPSRVGPLLFSDGDRGEAAAQYLLAPFKLYVTNPSRERLIPIEESSLVDGEASGTPLYFPGPPLFDVPIYATDFDETGRLKFSSGTTRDAAGGRYLPILGMNAVFLSEWNSSAALIGQHQRHPTITGKLHPLLTEEQDYLARATDASSFRVFPTTQKDSLESTAGSIFQRQAKEGSIIFFTTYVDGVGTFSALTNGTIRVHFDDRTILTLIPNVSYGDFEEEHLVLSVMFRDATQCTMRASQVTPTHACFRYLAHALPFRRYILAEAASQARPTVDPTSRSFLEDPFPSGEFHISMRDKRSELDTRMENVFTDLPSNEKGTPHATRLEDKVCTPPDIFLTNWAQTLQQKVSEESLERQQYKTRVEELLAESAELTRINQSLLSDAL